MMARRRSPARRSPHGPLVGVLRDLNRRTRKARTRGQRGPDGPQGPAGSPGRTPAAAVVTTDHDGRGAWAFARPLTARPVITALPHAPNDAFLLLVTLEQATTAGVTVRVWRTPTGPGAGARTWEPAAAGVEVHLTATAASTAGT